MLACSMWISSERCSYGLYEAAEVRLVCRVAGIFVRVEIGLWKVEKNSSKVEEGGEKFRAATGYATCIFRLSPKIGSRRERTLFCDFNLLGLWLTVTKFADWSTVSVFSCFCASSFLLGRVGVLGLAGIDGASARDVSSKSGLAMAGFIGMGVVVGLFECHWIWVSASP